jgi:hypothetical protein
VSALLRGPYRGALVAVAAVALLTAALVQLSRTRADTASGPGFLAAAELDSLASYTGPMPPAVAFDEYDAYLPAALPPPPPPRPSAAEPIDPVDPARWRLSAILITGGRPLAIINDRQVRAGERLDGAEVLTIERDRVVLRHRDGSRHTLRLNDSFERTL